MRFSTLIRFSLFAFITFVGFSCQNKDAVFDGYDFQPERLTELIPLQPGKYITYRLDSTVFPNFGRRTETHSYQVKHVVDAMVKDNLGRSSYRIFRYMRDSSGINGWSPNGSYLVTPLKDQVEVIDDNLRVVKIRIPVREDNHWQGNKYLPENPYDILNQNNGYDNDLGNWDFFFDGPKTSALIGTKIIPDVFTVKQADETYNLPIVVDTVYASKTLSVEKYAINIGLVYKEYVLWERQPNGTPVNNPPNPPFNRFDPFTIGFGIKMWMIDHN